MDNQSQQNSSVNIASSGSRGRKKPHPMTRQSSTGNSSNLEEVLAAVHHHRNNSIYDGQSATADEGSEFHARPSRQKNIKHSKLINTIVLWVKNVNKMRAMQICKAFYCWKYYQPPIQSSGETSSETNKASSFSEQKSSYLQLFTDNEKLREQLFDIKKSMKHNEKNTRYNAMKILLATIVRKKLTNKLRYYYDIWFHNVRMTKLTADTQTRSLALEIGLQQIAAEQDSMTRYKRQNHTLSMSLMTVIFFFKWKNKTILSLLASERKKYLKQQTLLYEELKRLKEKVSKSNQQEKEYLHKSVQDGVAARAELRKLHLDMQQLLVQSRTLSPPHTVPSTHSTPTVTSTNTNTAGGRKTLTGGNTGGNSGSKKPNTNNSNNNNNSNISSNSSGTNEGNSSVQQVSSAKKLWASVGMGSGNTSPNPASSQSQTQSQSTNTTTNNKLHASDLI